MAIAKRIWRSCRVALAMTFIFCAVSLTISGSRTAVLPNSAAWIWTAHTAHDDSDLLGVDGNLGDSAGGRNALGEQLPLTTTSLSALVSDKAQPVTHTLRVSANNQDAPANYIFPAVAAVIEELDGKVPDAKEQSNVSPSESDGASRNVLCEMRQSCALPSMYEGVECGVRIVGNAHTDQNHLFDGRSIAEYVRRTFEHLPFCTTGDAAGRWLVACPITVFALDSPPPSPMRLSQSRSEAGWVSPNASTCDWDRAIWQPYECRLPDLSVEEARECLADYHVVTLGDSTLRGIINATVDVAGLDGMVHKHEYWSGATMGIPLSFMFFPRCKIFDNERCIEPADALYQTASRAVAEWALTAAAAAERGDRRPAESPAPRSLSMHPRRRRR
eukprot:Opistho-2@95899